MSKAKYRVKNWSEYNKALKARGSVTFWLDEKAIGQWWHDAPNGKRGRDLTYSDQAIVTFMMLQAVYKLSLRSTEGFLNSLFKLMNVTLKSPDYSSVSKRARTVKVKIPRPTGPVAHVVFDATGLKIFGEGEWKVRKHGQEKRRTWRKLHLGVDVESQQVVCEEISLVNVGDNEVLPTMLKKMGRRKVGKVTGDGAYDTQECYRQIADKKAIPCIPPRSNARYWRGDHPRNDAVRMLKQGQLAQWKRDTGYHQRSLAETAMWRFKSLTGERLRYHSYNAQVGEGYVRVAVLNKLTRLGMPVSEMVR